MVSVYKTKVIESKGLRVKGDDSSSQLAEILEKESNKELLAGWKVHSITPSLSSNGAILKFVVLFQKQN